MSDELTEKVVYAITILLGGLAVLAAPLSRRIGWLLLAAGIPWASEIIESGTTTLTLPTDIFAAIGGLGIVVYLLFSPSIIAEIWRSSLLRWLGAYFLWMGITIAFSTDAVVSLKFWISQIAYAFAFGVGGYLYMRNASQQGSFVLPTVLLLSALGVLGICVFTHISLGGTKDTVERSISPFMREHTVYGAYSAWFFTMSVVLLALTRNLMMLGAVVLSGAALFLSYSRGGWLTALAVLAIWAFIELLRRLSSTARFFLAAMGGLFLLIAGVFIFSYNPEILQLQIRQKFGEVGQHFASSFDLKSNLSNMERINRWFSAIQMIEDRPIFGFGANTFMKEYSAYQRSLTRTPVSVEMGEVGGAHSEYLTAASELGLPGLFFLLGIYLTSLFVGLGGLIRKGPPELRWRYALFTLPLLSYYLHGFINNFMDHGHVAGLVYLHWGILAALQKEAVSSPYAELERV
ncbi:MAG: O-antigen ligase family protein [Bacteroidia bacterium]|nr:O-antigen ligase family protein [Bacteroidia bacterium]MDW8057763.1 O-antigen ligase family protein [Bacteroidia bacterium]